MEQNEMPDPVPVEGDTPAVAEEPNQMVEERYRVTGVQPVFGWTTGEEFSATFTPEQKEYYLTGRHLEVVTDANPQPQQEVEASVEVKPELTDVTETKE